MVRIVREFRRVHADDDEHVPVAVVQRAQLLEDMQAVDAAERPEVEQYDLAAEIRPGESGTAGVEPATGAGEFRRAHPWASNCRHRFSLGRPPKPATRQPLMSPICLSSMLRFISVTPDSIDVAVFLQLVGRRVMQAREGRGITHAWLAAQAGLSTQAIVLLEQGECGIDVDQLHRVAEVLGLGAADLLPDVNAVRQRELDREWIVDVRKEQDPAGGRPAGS